MSGPHSVEMNRPHHIPPPPEPEEEEEDDKSTSIREKPEEPGMLDNICNTMSKPGVKGLALAVGAVALAVFVLTIIMPNMLHVNIFDPKSSFNSLPVIVAVCLLGGVGLFGLGAQLNKHWALSNIWMVCKAVLPILLAGCAMWWSYETLKVLADQGNYWTGPFLWAALGGFGGGIYAWSLLFHSTKLRASAL